MLARWSGELLVAQRWQDAVAVCTLWGQASNEAAPWLRAGVAELRLDRPEHAREAFARAARRPDACSRVALGAAEASLRLGRTAEAQAQLAHALPDPLLERRRTALVQLAARKTSPRTRGAGAVRPVEGGAR